MSKKDTCPLVHWYTQPTRTSTCFTAQSATSCVHPSGQFSFSFVFPLFFSRFLSPSVAFSSPAAHTYRRESCRPAFDLVVSLRCFFWLLVPGFLVRPRIFSGCRLAMPITFSPLPRPPPQRPKRHPSSSWISVRRSGVQFAQ